MADIATAIKRVVRDYLAGEGLSDLIYATYTGAGLKIDGKPLPVPAELVDIPLHLQTIEGELSFSVTKEDLNADGEAILETEPAIDRITIRKLPITIRTGIQPGDRVAVVQKRGGQRYSIIDRVV